MTTRRKLLLVAATALLALAGGVAAFLTLYVADIRPSSVSLDADPAAETRGRELLAKALEAHGGEEKLHSHEGMRFDLTDTWYGPARLFCPWPDPSQQARMTTRIHTFDSSAKLFNGPEMDVTWGITNWTTWREKDGARTESPDKDIRFILPTVQYFLEIPQRITEAEIVRHVGTETIRGVDYEVVYATWGTVEANPEFDQYLIYLDPKSGRIAKTFYTVREMGGFITGVAHLLDQRSINGFYFPHRLVVTNTPTDDPEGTKVHETVFSNMTFLK